MPKRKRSGTSTEFQDANILSSMQSAECRLQSMFKLTVTDLTSMPRSSFKFSIKEYILRLQEKMVKELGRVAFHFL